MYIYILYIDRWIGDDDNNDDHDDDNEDDDVI